MLWPSQRQLGRHPEPVEGPPHLHPLWCRLEPAWTILSAAKNHKGEPKGFFSRPFSHAWHSPHRYLGIGMDFLCVVGEH